MSELTKFNYEGNTITFEFSDGNRMINATEMAKPFNKRINDFLRQKSTQDYILVLEDRYNTAATQRSREKNIPTGTVHDERYGKVRTYHEDILKWVIK